jgi:phosphoribosylanthranilate isomerase
MLLEKPGVPSKAHSDRISVSKATTLVAELPGSLRSVLLVHDTDLDLILELAERISPAALQVQAPIPPPNLRKLKMRSPHLSIIKTFSIQTGVTIEPLVREIQGYWECGSIDAALLDSVHGGSGRVHDWPLSAKLIQRLPQLPIILAGGLTSTNVAEALRQVRPNGVDVMTGITSTVRDRKDHNKLRAFVAAVRSAGTSNE